MAVTRLLRAPGPALLAATLLVSACEKPVTSVQEAAQRVLDSPAWLSIADRCPADVMKRDMRVNGLASESCAAQALPSCFSRCRDRDVDACFWLAYELQQAKVDTRASEALFQRACLLGEPSGCTNRAAGMLFADREDKDVQRCTSRTFEATCELEDSWGCTMLGNALHEGMGTRRDDARALEVLDKACLDSVRDDVESCVAARKLTESIRAPEPGE